MSEYLALSEDPNAVEMQELDDAIPMLAEDEKEEQPKEIIKIRNVHKV